MKRVNLSPTEYHQRRFDPVKLPNVAMAGPVSASILSSARSPITFLANKVKKQTKAMQWGTIIDVALLTPEDFDNQCILLPAEAPKDLRQHRNAAKPSQSTLDSIAFWDAFEQRAIGKTIVDVKTLEMAEEAVRMLKQNRAAAELLACSEKQVALMGNYYRDATSKCLIDLLPMDGRFKDAVVDYKSCHDVSPRGIKNAIVTFEYDMKMGHYGLLSEAAGLGDRPRAILIFQRSKWPYDVHVRELEWKDIELGRQLSMKRFDSLWEMDARNTLKHMDHEIRSIALDDWSRDARLREIHGQAVPDESEPEEELEEEEAA